MQLNTSKTKEMILGRIDSTSTQNKTPSVITFKLLGLHLDAGFCWMTDINTIVSKASKRLYFLKQLRRASVPPQQLLHFLARDSIYAIARSLLTPVRPPVCLSVCHTGGSVKDV